MSGHVLGAIADRFFALTGAAGSRGNIYGGLLCTAWFTVCGSALGALMGWWMSIGQRWSAACVLAAGAPVLATVTVLADYGELRALYRHGTRTTAVIESRHSKHVHIPSGYSGWITTLQVRFVDTDGAEMRATCSESGRLSHRSHRPGSALQVIYDPRKPGVVHRVDPNGYPDTSSLFDESCWLTVSALGMVVLAITLVI